jgi:antitoxin MazE
LDDLHQPNERESAILSAVKKFGTSAGIIIRKLLLAEFGVEAGDNVELKVEAGRIVIERVTNPPRQGWADDAKKLSASGQDVPAWPEFGNEENATLTW